MPKTMTSNYAQTQPFNSPVVTLVNTNVSGRLRLQIRGLYRSDLVKTELEKNLAKRSYIMVVNANPLTGNLLLLYAVDQDQSSIIHEVEMLVLQLLKDYPQLAEHRLEPIKPSTSASAEQPEKANKKLWFNFQRLKQPQTPGPLAIADQVYAWHTLSAEQTLIRLESLASGLSVEDAERRLLRDGLNRLSENKRRSTLQIFTEQFINAPMALLGVSAVVSIATGGFIDAAVILSAILLNSVIGYVTESASERTINALGSMKPTHTQVLRSGKRVDIPVEEVVAGDILLLTPGAYVAADAILLSSTSLTVDESALTGESLPVSKHCDFISQYDTPLADRKNMLHMGTIVTGGSALAIVVATANNTEIGFIQSLVGEVKPPTTLLQRQLDAMGRQMAWICGGLCLGVFGIGMLRGYTWLQMLSSSISLAVAAIPEGMPAVATSTLAIGIRNMKREHVLIRQLPAVESLGSVDVICLDKTGTLTQNKMKVVTLRTPRYTVEVEDNNFTIDGVLLSPLENSDLQRLLQVVCLCSEVKLSADAQSRELEGSPTECILVETALFAGEDVRSLRARHRLRRTVHRAENRPYMVTVHDVEEGGQFYAVKGSPADVLQLCTRQQCAGGLQELNEEVIESILATNDVLAQDALRVLGIAYHYTETGYADDSALPPLVWVGLVGMEDALRSGVRELMTQFHSAGVRTVMITGDQSATAYSVAKRLDLNNGDVLDIIDSSSLDKLDPDILKGIISNTSVFARVSPAHKLKIVQALQEAGHVVAMTGDGINDGPALKAADIGVAMGKQGADVARSVADVVLENDNLETMVAAIRQGRTIYSNIRKSLRFLLATNLSEIELVALTIILGWGEALNPLQLLWINMVADIAPAMALSLEPPELDVLKQPPRDPKQAIINHADFWRLLRESFVVTGGVLGVYALSMRRYGPGLQASSNTFHAFVLAKILHALSCRSEETTVLNRNRPANPYIAVALAGTFAIQGLAAILPQLQGMLRTSPLAMGDLLLISAGAGIPFVFNEGFKPGLFKSLLPEDKSQLPSAPAFRPKAHNVGST